MSEFNRCCCLFFLVKILTGSGISSKFVCPGESVQLFKMTNFDNCNAVVSLFVHGDRITQIAKWTLSNCTLNLSLLPEYKSKVSLNTNGTILLHDVHLWDEGIYTMRKEDTMPMKYEEQIYVMELPTTECRPTILQLENSLSVSLKHDVCGKPLATPYWRDCCGVSYSNESVLKFSSGKESCTCHACIVSPAQKCAKNSTSLDYCSTFIRGGTGTTPVSLETMDVKMTVVVTVCITLFISFLLVIIIKAILIHRKQNIKKRQLYRDSKQSDAKVRHRYIESNQSVEVQDLLCIRETEPSIVIESDAKVRHRYIESNQSAEVQDLLCIRETEPSTAIESDVPILNTGKASTKHRLSHKSKLIREIGPDAGLCTFCGQENSAMFVLPCEHLGHWYMPACIKCGISRGPCEQCMTSKRKSMEFATWTVLTELAQT